MKFLTRFSKRKTASESKISRALAAVVKGDNGSTRRSLYQALRNQRLILPLSKAPDNVEADASGRLQRDVWLDFLSCKDQSGSKFLAVFTNPHALKKWKSDVPTWIAVDTPSLCRLAWILATQSCRSIPEVRVLYI